MNMSVELRSWRVCLSPPFHFLDQPTITRRFIEWPLRIRCPAWRWRNSDGQRQGPPHEDNAQEVPLQDDESKELECVDYEMRGKEKYARGCSLVQSSALLTVTTQTMKAEGYRGGPAWPLHRMTALSRDPRGKSHQRRSWWEQRGAENVQGKVRNRNKYWDVVSSVLKRECNWLANL